MWFMELIQWIWKFPKSLSDLAGSWQTIVWCEWNNEIKQNNMELILMKAIIVQFSLNMILQWQEECNWEWNSTKLKKSCFIAWRNFITPTMQYLMQKMRIMELVSTSCHWTFSIFILKNKQISWHRSKIEHSYCVHLEGWMRLDI